MNSISEYDITPRPAGIAKAGFLPLRLCVSAWDYSRKAREVAKETVTLDEKLREIPTSPGVYLHKDTAGKIIYIGKAKNLRNRVRSYFQSSRAGEFSYGI